MKTTFSLVIGFVIFVCGSVSATEKIVFSHGNPLDTHQATIIIPLLTEAFKRHGYDLDVVELPAHRSLVEANSGRVDGDLSRVSDFHSVSQNQYSNLIRIESKLMSVSISLFANKDLILDNPNDLSGLHIGYKRGEENTRKLLTDLYPADYIFATDSNEMSLRILAKGRLDVIVSESVAGNRIIKNNAEFKNLVEKGDLRELHIFAFIHRKHKKLGEQIALTLEAMKQDGSFAQITAASIAAIESE